MTREEFLNGLEEALIGEVPAAVIRDNLNYYGSYLSQETAKGRTVDEIVAEIGGPRIVAQTIIDVGEAGGERGVSYAGGGSGGGGNGRNGGYGSYDDGEMRRSGPNIHYFDLNQWYWRILIPIILILIVCVVVYAVGGIFYLLIRFAGPIFLIYVVYQIFKHLRN